jgi:hypothetical protein
VRRGEAASSIFISCLCSQFYKFAGLQGYITCFSELLTFSRTALSTRVWNLSILVYTEAATIKAPTTLRKSTSVSHVINMFDANTIGAMSKHTHYTHITLHCPKTDEKLLVASSTRRIHMVESSTRTKDNTVGSSRQCR